MPIRGADLFCGAGGTSTGLLRACEQLGRRADLLAINHWNIAIDTHTRNHPHVRHLCESLDNLDPRRVVPDGHLHILCASPECTHHSNAAGGRPKNDQSRATAWHVCRWLEALRVDAFLIENVREFRNWGPLGKSGKPLKRRKCQTFNAFIEALRSLDYQVEYRIVNCADYGDPTTRQRLFIAGRRGRAHVTWPDPSHGIGTGRSPWRAAREIIDWGRKGKSIFKRKRPLCANTMKRIFAGLEKFSGMSFIVPQFSDHEPRSVDRPLGTITTTSRGVGLVEPFLVSVNHGSTDENHGTVGRRTHSVNAPVPTITKVPFIGLCEPFVIQTDQTGGNGAYVRDVDQPLYTCVTKQNMALIQPMMLGQQSGAVLRPVSEPCPTVATAGAIALIEPFIVKYYGAGENVHSVREPLATVTTRDRFMLVEPVSRKPVAEIDILFRMLEPHELAGAQGFPSDYQFAGSREDRIKQIGNAVPVNTAAALCKALLS